MAFSELARSLILTTEVDNSVASTGYTSNPYVCENTNDKIFLLSYSEVTNSAYGFSSNMDEHDIAKRKATSDYSRAQGVYMVTSSDYYCNSFWWLRSPFFDGSYFTRNVYYNGYASDGGGVDYGNGTVPALRITL